MIRLAAECVGNDAVADVDLQGPWGSKGLAAASIVVGLIVWGGGGVASLGGPTVPGLNPIRDLVPRFLHWILPVPNKGDSR